MLVHFLNILSLVMIAKTYVTYVCIMCIGSPAGSTPVEALLQGTLPLPLDDRSGTDQTTQEPMFNSRKSILMAKNRVSCLSVLCVCVG